MLALSALLVYYPTFFLSRLAMSLGFGYRYFGTPRVPRTGGVLLASNHQSNFDPVLVGIALDRPIHFMARDTLFSIPGFRTVIRALNAFPVRRATADLEAMREALRRLKAGNPVLMFPEGTRTSNGEIGTVHAGVVLLAARAGVPIVPVVIDGAFEAWPRHQTFPRRHRLRVLFGNPIAVPSAEARDRVLQELTSALHALQAELRGQKCSTTPAASAVAMQEPYPSGRGPTGPHLSNEAHA